MKFQTVMLLPVLVAMGSFSAVDAQDEDDYSVFRSSRRGEAPDQDST